MREFDTELRFYVPLDTKIILEMFLNKQFLNCIPANYRLFSAVKKFNNNELRQLLTNGKREM